MSLKAEDPARLQHEELHAEILRDVSDAVIATDRAMRIVTWNEAACRMYGWTKEEALGSVLDDLLQTRFITTSQPEAQRVLIENRYWAGQIEQTTKDGIQLTVDARVSLLTGPDGEAIGGVTVNRDVTEEYLLRTLLRIQRDMLVRIGSADTAVDVAQIALQSTCKLDGIECGAVYLRSEVGTGDVLEMVTSIGIPTHDVTVVARIPVTRRFEVHAEYFGTFTQGLLDDVNRPFFSPGMHLIIGENAELGLRVGWGLTRDAANFFSDAGLAIRY